METFEINGELKTFSNEKLLEENIKFRNALLCMVKKIMYFDCNDGGICFFGNNYTQIDKELMDWMSEVLRYIQNFRIEDVYYYTRSNDNFPIEIEEGNILSDWANTRIIGDKWEVWSSLFVSDYNKYASPAEAILDNKNKFSIMHK